MSLRPGARVYLDTNLLIYLVEDSSEESAFLDPFLKAYEARELVPVVSVLSWAECLVLPIRKNDRETISQYNALFSRSEGIEVLEFTKEMFLGAAKIRALAGINLADALHLEAARQGKCDLFLTNDLRLFRDPVSRNTGPLNITTPSAIWG